MNLRDLEYLVAVAEHRHFGKAADACYVSQPTLSTQVKKLETELGLPLLERNPRQVLLTEAGQLVVDRARAILAEVDEIRTIARHSTDPRSGTLRLGAFPTLAPYLLPHVVPPLTDAFPELELLLIEEKTETLVEQLAIGRLDAAILATPVASDTVVSEPLFIEQFLLAMPRGHRLDRSGPVDVAELDDEPLLLLGDGHCLRDQALSFCPTAAALEREGFQATSLETLRLMVAAGVGTTLLPALAAQPPVPQSPDVVLRRFSDPAPHREVALHWRRSSVFRSLLPEIAAVIRQIEADLVTPAPQPAPSAQ